MMRKSLSSTISVKYKTVNPDEQYVRRDFWYVIFIRVYQKDC